MKLIQELLFGKKKIIMQNKFKKCLEYRKIVRFNRGPNLVSKELKLSLDDLNSAKDIYKRGNYKWTTVHAYYSMFHAGRSLLYIKRYREKSHYCLIEAIRELYVKEKELSFVFIENIQKAKSLREEADYYGEYKKSMAKDLIKKAEEFLNEAKKIIKNKK